MPWSRLGAVQLPNFEGDDVMIVGQVAGRRSEAHVQTGWQFDALRFEASLAKVARAVGVDFDRQFVVNIP